MSRIYITDAIHADGKVENNTITAEGKIGYLKEVYAPLYEGPYTASVRDTPIMLETNGKQMTGDITVMQGFARYNGPYRLTLSNAGDHVLTVINKWCDDYITVNQPYTHYSGPMTFTVVNDDIVQVFANEWINGAMFIRQGITPYTGQTAFTIVDSSLTIPTNGKRLSSDITVDISSLETLATQISGVVG